MADVRTRDKVLQATSLVSCRDAGAEGVTSALGIREHLEWWVSSIQLKLNYILLVLIITGTVSMGLTGRVFMIIILNNSK